ncbi:MAG: methyltransferase domain-containing protein [Candidatus Diapherotrites archaeon]|nr:methyltransferase domain-containing protein [Candidatus Diapherotrites archaeon]
MNSIKNKSIENNSLNELSEKNNSLKNELLEKENSLKKYNLFLQRISPSLSIELLAEIQLKKNKKIKVMDLGCGNAGALKELKKKFKEKIHCIGLDAVEFNEKEIDEKIIADAMKIKFPKEIDLIFSFRTIHLIGSVKELLNKTTVSLSSGGAAVYSIRIRNNLNFEGKITELDELFLKKIIAEKHFNDCEVKGEIVSINVEVTPLIQGINLFLKKN